MRTAEQAQDERCAMSIAARQCGVQCASYIDLTMIDVFADRCEAGRLLGRELLARRYAEAVVIALPRGGVPVAVEVALALDAPLDLVMVHKIGAPANRELAVAALAEGTGGTPVVDQRMLELTGTPTSYVQREAKEALQELVRRRSLYLRDRSPLPVVGKTAIVVDDGLATGTTARAALRALRSRRPARLVLAVPVGSTDALAALRAEADDLICLAQPECFRAVALHYADFHQISDQEVMADLVRAAGRRAAWRAREDRALYLNPAAREPSCPRSP